MKKLFILLFPENDFFSSDTKTISLFNQCIDQRYIKQDYDFCIVNHKNSKCDHITIKPTFIIEDNLTFEEASKLDDGIKNNLEQLSKNTLLNTYEHIVIGGFLCFNCVEKFATYLSLNKDVTIDTDLTDLFEANIHDKEWDVCHFCPDKRVKKLLLYKDKLTLDIFNEIATELSLSIWGISESLVEELNENLHSPLLQS